MQVYRGMDIGTAKPSIIERAGIPHHMIDIIEPDEELSVAEFRLVGRRIIADTTDKMIITGGSGLHFRSLVDPMSFGPTDPTVRRALEEEDPEALRLELKAVDPKADALIDFSNKRRLIRAVEIYRLSGETPSSRAAKAEAQDLRTYTSELAFEAIGIDPGDEVEERIRLRLGEMRSGGLVDEVRRLQSRLGRTARAAVGYREILAHLDGEMTLDDAFALIETKTRKLAKKQRTWFQRDPRVRWIPWVPDTKRLAERAMETLA